MEHVADGTDVADHVDPRFYGSATRLRNGVWNVHVITVFTSLSSIFFLCLKPRLPGFYHYGTCDRSAVTLCHSNMVLPNKKIVVFAAV